MGGAASDILGSYTFRTVLAGSVLLGVVAGVMGCFAFIRRQSLLGDALAHAALPGVCLAFLATGGKEPLALLGGAALAGVAGAMLILAVVRGSRVKEDSAIGIVLSVFFGLGIVLLTVIQRMPIGNQAGLDRILFGQAATLLAEDVLLFGVVLALVLLVLLLLYKELKLVCFDRPFAASIGLPVRRLEALLTLLLVLVVVTGLQTVGVVLIIAALVTPAAAARQWTDRFGVMLLVAAAIGALSSGVGVLASATVARLPTGPAIVLVASGALVVSLLFAPGRGVLATAARARRLAVRVRRENLLKDLYLLEERQGGERRPVSLPVLMGVRGQPGRQVARLVGRLAAEGLLAGGAEAVALTGRGRREAERVVRRHRLWELYLSRRLDLPSDRVHRDAEQMEHALTDEAADAFARLLGDPGVDPHGRPIPPRRPAA